MIERVLLDPGHDLHPHQRDEEVPALLAWIDLQGLALWESMGDLDRGKLEASLSDLAERWNWSKSRVRRLLNKLEEDDEIEWNRGGGADTSRVRIIRYNEVQAGSSNRTEGGGTDTPTRPPSDTRKNPRHQGIRQGGDTPNDAPPDTPHIYTEEEVKNGRTPEEKEGGHAPIENRFRTVWNEIQQAAEDGRLDEIDLDPLAEKAFQQAGGTDKLKAARRRKYGLSEFKNTLREAYHDYASFGEEDE